MTANKNTCIVIVGPTAVGKTALAIDIAQYYHTAIISADSRQCYKELNIGVAKPSEADLQRATHYFVNSHSIHETVTAAIFEQYALQKLNQIFSTQPVAVMVGGTGLYVKAFCEGLDAIPPIPAAVRAGIMEQFNVQGLQWLQEQVQLKDPLYFTMGEIQNPQRLIRALEVVTHTGNSILDFQKKEIKQRDFHIIYIGLELPRAQLYAQINSRVDAMMEAGLLEEVEALKPYLHLNALQTVGYSEFFQKGDPHTPLSDAIALVKQHTRHYAKRQLTWFKKQSSIAWFHPQNKSDIIDYINNERAKLP